MTQSVRKNLEQIPLNRAEENLQETFYDLLDEADRDEIAIELQDFFRSLENANRYLTEDERVRLLYEVLSASITYDRTKYKAGRGRMRYSYSGCLTCGKAVCIGIAQQFTQLGTLLGLQVQTIVGYGGDPARKGGRHAWNLVWLNDPVRGRIPYHVDLTWDLIEFSRNRGFMYFLKSDEYMQKNNHQWLPERYPPCVHNREPAQIAHIPHEVVDWVCRRYKLMVNRLAHLHKV